jgi:hypothetical protein
MMGIDGQRKKSTRETRTAFFLIPAEEHPGVSDNQECLTWTLRVE